MGSEGEARLRALVENLSEAVRLLAAPGETASVAVRLQHRDGTLRTVELSGADLLRADGEAVDDLGRRVGAIAHDLNNVLGVIRGRAQLLAVDLDRGEPAESVAEILRAIDRAIPLVRRLMEAAGDDGS